MKGFWKMAIFRIEKNANYTVMSNHHLRNKNLSLKAKGLLSYMLSCPDDWDFSLEGLRLHCKETTSTLNDIVKELIANGYIEREQKRNHDGTWSKESYVVHEQPLQKIHEQGFSSGNEIKEILKKKGISQKQLSNLLGIQESLLSKYINGKRKPNAKEAQKIIQFTGVCPAEWNGNCQFPSESSSESTDNSTFSPYVEIPHTVIPHTVIPHTEIPAQLNIDKQSTERQSIVKPNTKFVLSDVLRACARVAFDEIKPEDVSDYNANALQSFVEQKIGRPLDYSEKTICEQLILKSTHPVLIGLAIEDNMYRKKYFDMKYVKMELEKWSNAGRKTPVQVRNEIINTKMENLENKAMEDLEEENPYMSREQMDKRLERYYNSNPAYIITSTRDEIKRHISSGNYEKIVEEALTVKEQYGISVIPYLDPLTQKYIRERTAEFEDEFEEEDPL